MIALIRKDFRVYRAAFIAVALWLIVILLNPIVNAIIMTLQSGSNDAANVLEDWGMAGHWVVICVAAVFGGCAFAIERRDRSAEFLAMMPISRGKILASKLITASVAVVPLWFIASCMLAGFCGILQSLQFMQTTACVIVLAFGISWLCSALTRSPSISACLGLAGVLLEIVLATQVHEYGYSNSYIMNLVRISAAVTGIFCFIGGCIVFTRRVSP